MPFLILLALAKAKLINMPVSLEIMLFEFQRGNTTVASVTCNICHRKSGFSNIRHSPLSHDKSLLLSQSLTSLEQKVVS